MAEYISRPPKGGAKGNQNVNPINISDEVMSYVDKKLFQQGKNLVDKNSIKMGYFVSYSNGQLTQHNDYTVSDFIPVLPLTDYRRTHITQLAFYDSNKKFISGIGQTNKEFVFKTPDRAEYLRVSILKNDVDKYQIEKGTKFTGYEEYGVKLKSQYVKPTRKTIQSIMSKIVLSPSPKKIKFIGDSITHGSGGSGFAQDGETIMTVGSQTWKVNTNGQCWANSMKRFLEEKHGCTVYNYGCSGANSTTLVRGLSQLIKNDDDIVVCMIGTNDRHNNTKQLLKDNLKSIYAYCLERGIEVIFMSNIPSSVAIESEAIRLYHMEDVDHIIMSTAEELNLEYISVYKKFIEYCQNRGVTIDSLLADGLHPNDSGHNVMFYLIANALGFGVKRDGATW